MTTPDTLKTLSNDQVIMRTLALILFVTKFPHPQQSKHGEMLFDELLRRSA
jgi:hypothetical protein